MSDLSPVRLVQKSVANPAAAGELPADFAQRVATACAALTARSHPRYAFLDAGTDQAELAKITALSERLRAQTDDLIVLGIGGSALGTTAFMHAAVAPRRDRVWVLESPDPVHLQTVLGKLNPARTAVNVVSKSGTTLETLSQWSVIEAWLKKAGAFDRSRVVMTTDPKSGPLRAHVEAQGYESLPVPEMVGGRFSVFTPVGLLPLAYAGVDLGAIAAGVSAAARDGLAPSGVAATVGLTLAHAQLAEGRPNVVVWPYGERLQPLGRWFQQLWGESLGKAQRLDGSPAHVGSTPLACVGPNDQHSLLQLFGDGPRDKHYLFVCAEQVGVALKVADTIKGSEFMAGAELHDILKAEARATAAALASQGLPCSFIWLRDMHTATMARVFVELMAATVIAAALYQVDPFDQPAVELGKRIALGLLGHPKHKDEAASMAQFLP